MKMRLVNELTLKCFVCLCLDILFSSTLNSKCEGLENDSQLLHEIVESNISFFGGFEEITPTLGQNVVDAKFMLFHLSRSCQCVSMLPFWTCALLVLLLKSTADLLLYICRLVG